MYGHLNANLTAVELAHHTAVMDTVRQIEAEMALHAASTHLHAANVQLDAVSVALGQAERSLATSIATISPLARF